MVKEQPDATLDQANPVSGTKYTVLDTVRNARIKSISVRCVWTVQPTPIELWVTIDGQTIRHRFDNPETAKSYYALKAKGLDANNQGLSLSSESEAFIYEGRSVKVEAEITGGTVSNLSARVKYAKL